MSSARLRMRVRGTAALGLAWALGLSAAWSAEPDQARQILAATGVQGGLVVHLGCGDGKLTASLRASDSYLVHGLDTDGAMVAKAREHIRSLGLYGPVSVDCWDGQRLPYVDNFANMLVADGARGVPMGEVMRVLAPNGVAWINKDGKWTKTVKPRPKDIDEWTHYLHDATNNAVAHDSVIGPPKRYQWLGNPRWARHHDHMASMSALVSANGRLFYIFDEGSTASIVLPSKWFLTARDAFNGTILWKRPIDKWHTQLWPLKSGPATLPRRLVAVGDRVYVTLGIDAPVSVLDAATGETVRTVGQTRGTEEIIASGGMLFLAARQRAAQGAEAPPPPASVLEIRRQQRQQNWDGANRTILAVQARSGKVLWRKPSQVVPLTLAADGQRVVFYDGDKVVCRNRETGAQLWASESLPRSAKFPSCYAPTLVLYRGVVLFAGGENMLPHHGAEDFMQALSAESGKVLWTAEHPPSGYESPEDILVASGLVWTGATAQGDDPGEFTGRDPRTGEVRSRYVPKVKRGWGHHRCHRAKATDRYILTSRSGIEFLDVASTEWVGYRWIRGACLYGIMPCNGLIYAPPHSCACSIEGKLFAFSAVAPARRDEGRGARGEGGTARLERGPAFGAIGSRQSAIGNANDWPTYRHDTTRSGFTKTSVPIDLKQAWQADLGGRLSSPVVADGKVVVASVDTHTVHALDAESGKEVWHYTAGGRVDSPPTIWQGRVLFGSADGWVYCVRGSDGQLIWRFRVAPEDRRMTAFEQVESLWPVSGSVLVRGDVAYCVAGRSAYLDGGLRLLRLDAKTGRKLSETLLDGRRKPGKPSSVALPDVLSSDGRHVYMKSLRFSMDGAYEGSPTRKVTEQGGEDAHLFSPTSLLDGTWWHRSYWVFGRAFAPGASGYPLAGLMAPSGRILVFDDSTVYGYGRKAKYYRWTTPLEYQLFAASKEGASLEMPPRARRMSYAQVAPSESLNPGSKPTTVEAWVKASAGNGVILARGGRAEGFALLISGGKPQLAIRTAKQLTTATSKENVVNRWVHLAGVLTPGRKLELYVNGKLAGVADAPRLPKLGPKATIDIGVDTDGAVGDYRRLFGLKGIMDELRVYSGALTAGEIQQHVANPTQTAAANATLALRYPFDKGKGKATDASGNGNDATTEGVRTAAGKVGRGMRFLGARPTLMKLPFSVKHHWSQEIPMFVRAMVLADKTLFIAGPPDLVDEEKAVRRLNDPRVQAALVEQAAALEGEKGALLWAVSAADGKKLAEHRLTTMPVFDGMIAARGRLYLATTDGKVICMAGGQP